jgi:hypothetical protein
MPATSVADSAGMENVMNVTKHILALALLMSSIVPAAAFAGEDMSGSMPERATVVSTKTDLVMSDRTRRSPKERAQPEDSSDHFEYSRDYS